MSKQAKKTKPKCIKGTACGYACISGKKLCSERIEAPDANALLKQAGASVKGDTDKAQPLDRGTAPFTRFAVNSAVGKLDLPDWALVESNAKAIPKLSAELQQAGFEGDSAEAHAIAFKNWVGVAYTKMSKLAYMPDADTDTEDNSEVRAVLGGAVRALKAMPPITIEAFKADHAELGKSASPEKDKPLNRWLKLESADVAAMAAKYKPGETVSEDGMFGTTHLSASDMKMFSTGANVQYSVNAKLDGTGGGRAVDRYKNDTYEGEVLYVPGTKFKVDKVESNLDLVNKSKPIADELNSLDYSDEYDRADIKKLWESIGEKPYEETKLSNGELTAKYYDDADIEAVLSKVKSQPDLDPRQELTDAGLPGGLIQVDGKGEYYIDSDFIGARRLVEPKLKIFMTEL